MVTKTLQLGKFRRFFALAAMLAILWAVYHLYIGFAGAPHNLIFRPVHVALALSVVFAGVPLIKSWRKRGDIQTTEEHGAGDERASLGDERAILEKQKEPWTWTLIDLSLVVVSLAIGLYYYVESDRIASRIPFIDDVHTTDVIVGVLLLVLILEACRRVVGWSLPIVAMTFLVYQFWGDSLGGLLRHPGLDWERFIDLQFLSLQGVFGTPIGVSANVVFYFILFAAFLEISGGGRLFINIALAITGGAKGGPAKASVLGSAMMGSLNGSAVANVVGTGVFTIPLMKRMGFKARFAGGVEAMASTGGQLLPPVMGAAAFIMAQMMGVPYHEVVIAAIIPALLYFTSGFLMVDKQARKDDIQPLPKEERPAVSDIVARLHLLLPLGYLAYMILSGRSLMAAAFEAIILAVVVGFVRKATWFTPYKLIYALESGARRAVNVAVPCAVAGIVVGVITQTNLGLRFTSLVLTVSGEQLVVALIVVMVATIIMGMGMPTSSAYIMAAVLLTPPLIELGVPAIAAHLFVFYFACLSMITPPVALAAFAAAAIAGSPIARTGVTAFVISLAAYLVPFAFVYSPELLMQGGFGVATVWYSLTALLGVYALACAIIGYEAGLLNSVTRVVFGVLAVALVFPGYFISGAAVVMAVGLIVLQHLIRSKRSSPQEPSKRSPSVSIANS